MPVPIGDRHFGSWRPGVPPKARSPWIWCANDATDNECQKPTRVSPCCRGISHVGVPIPTLTGPTTRSCGIRLHEPPDAWVVEPRAEVHEVALGIALLARV